MKCRFTRDCYIPNTIYSGDGKNKTTDKISMPNICGFLIRRDVKNDKDKGPIVTN